MRKKYRICYFIKESPHRRTTFEEIDKNAEAVHPQRHTAPFVQSAEKLSGKLQSFFIREFPVEFLRFRFRKKVSIRRPVFSCYTV